MLFDYNYFLKAQGVGAVFALTINSTKPRQPKKFDAQSEASDL